MQELNNIPFAEIKNIFQEILGKDIFIENVSRLKSLIPVPNSDRTKNINFINLAKKADVYRIKYSTENDSGDIILKLLVTDRASKWESVYSFINENEILPEQAQILDKGIVSDNSLISVNNVSFFYEIIDFVPGMPYSSHLTSLLESKTLENKDIAKAITISDYLAQIFNESHTSDRLMYVKETCNFVQHNLQKLDFFESDVDFYNKYNEEIHIIRDALEDLLINSVKHDLVCKVHNDFHPNNISFDSDGEFHTFDNFGNIYGEQAADLATISLFYIWYDLREDITGKPFLNLFNQFMNNYLDKTNNKDILTVLPIFYGVRALRLAYVNELIDQDPHTNKPLLNLVCESIKDGCFKIEKINEALKYNEN